MTIISAGIINDSGGGGTTVLEDFEESSPLNDYRGDKSVMSTTTTVAFNNSTSLDFDCESCGKNLIFYDGSGTHVTTDNTYRCAVRVEQADEFAWVGFFFDSGDTSASNADGYVIEFDAGASEGAAILKLTDGSISAPDGASFNVDADKWYDIEFSVDTSTSPNTISAEIFDTSTSPETSKATLSAQDGSYTSGDQGFGGNMTTQNGRVYIDYLRKTSDTPR